jgi:hypothetical protein
MLTSPLDIALIVGSPFSFLYPRMLNRPGARHDRVGRFRLVPRINLGHIVDQSIDESTKATKVASMSLAIEMAKR